MGRLVTGEISTLFNGVSRQPDVVRLPSQIEVSDNTVHSVVTGGVSKRMNTEHLANLAGTSTATDYAVHTIYRDSTEQYIVLVSSGNLQVFDALTGASKTVNTMAADAITYLTASADAFRFTTVDDTTFVTNTTVVVEEDTGTVAGTNKGSKQNFSDLPTTGNTTGDVWKILGDDSTGFSAYYVRWTGSAWEEWALPGQVNSLKATTMPYTLVRETDGTFTFEKASWTSRAVGDRTLTPAPLFVGKTINDVFFHRARLGFLADEKACFSRAGDTYNFWPTSAVITIDTDPFELTAPTTNVAIMNFAVPYRKTLFVTSESDQFEVSAPDVLSPTTASIDLATSYQSNAFAKPVTMGDELYFVGFTNNSSILWEYFFQESSVGTTAVDASKHVQGYLPRNVKRITAATSAGRIFLWSSDEPTNIYVYSQYWDGNTKMQSAWHRWKLEDTIQGLAVLEDYLYLVMRRTGGVTLERVPVDLLPDPAPLLDRRVSLTGSYDAGTGLTTWTAPYNHGNTAKVVLGEDFANQFGRVLTVSYPTSTTITAVGDYSAHAAYVGFTYEMLVTLSRLYLRNGDGTPYLRGRLQLRDLVLSYKDSGYFEVQVTASGRTTKTARMTGRILGSLSNIVGQINNVSGEFMCGVRSNAATVQIDILNSSIWPSTISSISWKGFYNETTLQESGRRR